MQNLTFILYKTCQNLTFFIIYCRIFRHYKKARFRQGIFASSYLPSIFTPSRILQGLSLYMFMRNVPLLYPAIEYKYTAVYFLVKSLFISKRKALNQVEWTKLKKLSGLIVAI